MDWEVLTIAIVGGIGAVLIFTFQVIKMGLAHEEKRLALKHGGGDAARLEQIVADSAAEMARLRQRVEVLERLATDDEQRLSREISGLHGQGTPR